MCTAVVIRGAGVKAEEPPLQPRTRPHHPAALLTSSSLSSKQETEIREQSVEQRRSLRLRYRALKNDIAAGKDMLARLDSEKFDLVLGNMDNLHHLITRPREQVTDAEALFDISSAFLASVKDVKRGGGISPADFVTGIMQGFGEVAAGREAEGPCIDWGQLGLQASSVFSDAPCFATMLGPLDSQPKVRKVPVQRRQRDHQTESSRPKEVEENGAEQTETDKNMDIMFKILRNLKSVPLEAIVLNRRSFSQTVENIFALSFLVKDGRAEISIHNGLHMVAPKNFPTVQARQNGECKMSQFVFRLDYKDWRIMQETIEEGQELMPHRPNCLASSSSTCQAGSRTPIRKNCRNRPKETPGSASADIFCPVNDGRQARKKMRSIAF